MINWSEEIVKHSSSPESPSQLWLWQRIANCKYKMECISSRFLTSIALQIDVWMDMIFLAVHVQTFITFMRHLCCKCRKSGFVKLEFPYFVCSLQTPWWNYFSSHYLTNPLVSISNLSQLTFHVCPCLDFNSKGRPRSLGACHGEVPFEGLPFTFMGILSCDMSTLIACPKAMRRW